MFLQASAGALRNAVPGGRRAGEVGVIEPVMFAEWAAPNPPPPQQKFLYQTLMYMYML